MEDDLAERLTPSPKLEKSHDGYVGFRGAEMQKVDCDRSEQELQEDIYRRLETLTRAFHLEPMNKWRLWKSDN